MMKVGSKISLAVVFLIFSIFFLVGLITFKNYGIWIDEEFQRSSGFYWLNYVLSFTPFENLKTSANEISAQIGGFSLPSIKGNESYGIIFDLPTAFIETVFEIEDSKNYFQFRHLLNFSIFFVSSIFFFKILLNRFDDYYLSIIGTLFYILSPRIYGSSFYNNKDIIFLSLLTIALYFCFKVFDKKNLKNLSIFALFGAILVCSRVLGIFLVISFLTFYLLSVFSNKKNLNSLFLISIFLILYFFFIIIFWPYLWSDAVKNFIFAIKFFSSYPLLPKMMFNGEYISSRFLPSSYIFVWVFVTTPILYTILFVIGYFQILKRFFLRLISIKENSIYNDFWRGINEKKDLFIFFNISVIVFFLVFYNTPLFNGWRHIYFLNVFFVYIAIIGLYRADIYLKKRYKKNFIFHISVLFLITVVYKMIVYHPFQSIYFNNYFNEISHEKFEIDMGGISGKKSLDKILSLEQNKNLINIGVASWLPLQRSIELLDKAERKRIQVVGQEYDKADYIYTNFMSEVDKNINDKYEIPSNFIKIDEYIIDGIKVYEIHKKE